MCARLLACPLCSQPGFLTLDTLRAGLVSVATRPLACPVCNEVLLGIDKLTIHLFSHSINQPNNEQPKIIDVSNGIDMCTMVRNVQNIPLQTWSIVSKNNPSIREEEKQDFHIQSKQPSIDPRRGFLDKTSNQQVIFVQNKNTLREENISDRQQDFGTKQVILLRDKEPEKIEDVANQTNLIFIPGRDALRDENDSRNQESSQVIFIPDKEHQDKSQPLNQQMVFLQSKDQIGDESTERTQEFSNKNCSNQQVIFLQNTEHVFPQGLNFFPDSVSECQNLPTTAMKNNLTEKIWDPSNQVQFPMVSGILEEAKKDGNHPAEKSNLKKGDTEQTPLKGFNFSPPKGKNERCDICGFYFPDKSILTLHKQVVHMMDKEDLSTLSEHLFKNYPCHLCTKVFKMRGSLMVHMRVAHTSCNSSSESKDSDLSNSSESGYNCPTCGKNFKKEQHVTQHLKTHEGKQWECDVCSKMFTTKYFLKKHKRLHSGEMPYKCNICDKTFTFQQSYHKHRLYHKDDKPHTCNTCGRSFKELSTLHNHERIHTGEKPFACETCGKCFRQRVSYLVHRRIHTGVMPYKCTACEKSFRYKVSQRTHKCPIQPSGTVTQQPESLVQILLQSPETASPPALSNQETPSLRLGVEENKYVLIVNDQGQHVLTRQSEVEDARTNEPAKSNDTETAEQLDYEKHQLDEPHDFFSMVMSPLSNDLSTPSSELEHLTLSSPVNQNNMQEINSDILNQDSYPQTASALQTINEDSLKELLYGITDK